MAFLAYQYVPLFLLEQETYRVLEATGSKLAGPGGYLSDLHKRETVRKQMTEEIRQLGVTDPDLETWIETEGRDVHVGALYSAWLRWPWGILNDRELIYEIEHTFRL